MARQVLAVVLALLVLVTSSRAATICVEQDGRARIEFVGDDCCDESTAAPAPGSSIAPEPACGGCDDTPLGVQTARPTTHGEPVKVWSSIPTSIVTGEDERGPVASIPTHRDDGQPPPRATRPAHLRC